MARRKRGFAIIVLRCALVGFGASAQQAALGTVLTVSSKPAEEAVSSNVSSQSLDMRLPESNDAPPAPLILAQTNPVAPTSQTAGSNNLGVQETKNADAPAEPQAVMREIKSATRLSGSKQRRRKPKMAGVPAGLQAVAQETKEPVAQETKEPVAQETKEPVAQETKEPVAQETKEPVAQETKEPVAQETKEPVAQGAEETETGDNLPAGAQKTKKALVYPTPQAEAGVAKLKKTGKKYGMAPVQWGVRLTETIGLERLKQTFHGVVDPAVGSDTQTSRTLVNTQTAEIHATTYVVAPYIASLSGKLGLVHSKDVNKEVTTNSLYGSNSSSTNTSNLMGFGDGSMSLFSRSRFPFVMSLGVRDSRESAELATQNSVNKYLDLDQSYTPLYSGSAYNIGYGVGKTINYGLSSIGGIPREIERRSNWRGRYTTATPEHRINADTKYKDRFDSTRNNLSRRTDTFSLSDTYLPSESLLTLSSIANIRLSRETSDYTNFRGHDVRAISYGRWQPDDEDIHLFLDGNVRLSSSTIASKAIENVLQSLSGNVNANYFFSKNLKGYATVGVTTTNINGVRDHSTNQLGRVSYTSNAIKLWKNSLYSWNANGGAANQTGTGRDKRVFGGVGHGLSIPYPFEALGKKMTADSRILQSIDNTISQHNGQSFKLVNGGSVSLAGASFSRPKKELMGGYGSSEAGAATTATLSVLDTRTYDGRNGWSQKRLYGLTLGLSEMGRTAYSRDGLEVEGTAGAAQGTARTEIFGKGFVRYRKTRVFNVHGLDYIGTLTVTPRRGGAANTGVSVDAQDPALPWIMDQRLTYKIGQNEVLLRGLFSDSNGTKNASLWLLFRAWRTIGN